ncbi:MAG: hypothetical protein AAF629_12075 [Chloroflexota bacterium]
MLHITSLLNLSDYKQLSNCLGQFADIGGVIDYIPKLFAGIPTTDDHRMAAITAMKIIDQTLEQQAIAYASEAYPIDQFFRISMDSNKLSDTPIPFSEFWGSDDVQKKRLGTNSWKVPNVDGYKRAFFLPPYGLYGNADFLRLFEDINLDLFGLEPEQCTVYRWSTNWSNYFEAGLEWWGAFYWTVYAPETRLLTTIGASATD